MKVINLSKNVTIKLIELPSGSFYRPISQRLGVQDPEDDRACVRVSSFMIGKYPVTQLQWETVMGNNPSYFKGEYLPVENVSWHDAQEFVNKLGEGYRLPYETEWEYACRGETSTLYSFGDDVTKIHDYAWTGAPCYNKNYYSYHAPTQTQSVGMLRPNIFGLYDMHGNVWEWCKEDVSSSDTRKFIKGGSWVDDTVCAQSGYSAAADSKIKSDLIGFRIVKSC